MDIIGDFPLIVDINEAGHYGGAGVYIINKKNRLNQWLKKEQNIWHF